MPPHAPGLSRFERDLSARAADELLDHRPGGHAPCSSEVLDGDRTERADGAGGSGGDGGPGGAAQH